MNAEWPSLMGVDPKDLEINSIDSASHGFYTYFEAPQTKSSNGSHSSHDSWPNVPPSAEGSIATAVDEPYLGMSAFDVNMSTFDADFQMDGSVGISAENEHTRGLQSVVDCDKSTNLSPNVGLGAQQALPLFMYPSVQQRLNQDSQTSGQNLTISMTNQSSAKIWKSRPTSSLHALNRVSPESRSTGRPRRCMTRISTTPNPRLMTSQTLKSCQPPSFRNLKPLAQSVLRNKSQREARNTQAPILLSKWTTDNDISHTYSTMLREALELAKGSIRPYSSFSRRKAIDIINQVAKLVDQLDQIAIEEEKYGSAATDDDELTPPSTNTEDSLSNSELIDVDFETDNTSVSSTSRQQVVENQSTVSVTDHKNETVHPPCSQCGVKSLYYCTREGCTYSTHSCAEWKRHEESQKHSQQERFMCLECPQSPPLVDVNGDRICEFCRTAFPSLGNLSAHYLQCQHAQRSGTTYGRKDRLIAHLRDHHTINNATQVAAAGRFTVDSKWPRQCGFCGVFFKTWDERMGHVASHFQEGLDMSAWKLPLPRSKDFHQTFKPQPKYGDDSDDDMDDTDGRPGHYKTGVKQDISSASSGPKQNSNENHELEKFHQRGRRHRNHSHPANQNSETIETTDQNQLWGTLVDKYCSYTTNPLACERASVTLERYLNDPEEPFNIQSSAESPGSPDGTLCRDTAARGVKISSNGADHKSTKQRLRGQRQTKSNGEPPTSKVRGNFDTEPNSKTSHQYRRKPVTCQEQFSDDLILEPEPIPISLEQLVPEVKGIYAGLVMVEAKCPEFDNEQVSLVKPNSGAELVRIGEHRAAPQARLSATTIKSCSHLIAAHSTEIYLSAACAFELLMEEFQRPMTPQLAIRLTHAAVRGFTKQDFNSTGLQFDCPEHQSVIAGSISAQTASKRAITPSSWLWEHRTINDQSADDAQVETDCLGEASSFPQNPHWIPELAGHHKLFVRLAQSCWKQYLRRRQGAPLYNPALNEDIPLFYKCSVHGQSLRRDYSRGLSAFHKPRGFLYERFLPGRQLLPELPNPKQTPLRLNGMDTNAPLHHFHHYALPCLNSYLVWQSILSPTIGLDFGCGFETSKSISRRFTRWFTRLELISTSKGSLKNLYEFDQNFFSAFVLLAQVPILIDPLQEGMDGIDLPFVRLHKTGKPKLQCLGAAVPFPILVYRFLRDPRKPWSRIKGQTPTRLKERLPQFKVRREAIRFSMIFLQGGAGESSFLRNAPQTAVNATDARPQNTSDHAPKFPARTTLGGINLRQFLKQTPTPGGSQSPAMRWVLQEFIEIISALDTIHEYQRQKNDTYPAMELSGSDASFSSSEDDIPSSGETCPAPGITAKFVRQVYTA